MTLCQVPHTKKGSIPLPQLQSEEPSSPGLSFAKFSNALANIPAGVSVNFGNIVEWTSVDADRNLQLRATFPTPLGTNIGQPFSIPRLPAPRGFHTVELYVERPDSDKLLLCVRAAKKSGILFGMDINTLKYVSAYQSAYGK